MPEKYYDKHGIKYYEIENGKMPLVIVHAQGVDSKSFVPVAKRLSKEFHVFALDCYGHGIHTEKPREFVKCLSDFKKQII